MGWLTDLFRIFWDAAYWNARKTAHALDGRRGPCPCQTPSDSGRAGETGCEAAHAYASPERFRVVCPLLKKRADGTWVCSVDATEVRPFWSRALALWTTAVAALTVALTLAAFTALRGLGYDISYRQVAWPPAWSEFRAVQSLYHLERARAAHADGRVQDALLSLSSAYELNPKNYPAGLLLAQLWQTGQPVASDRIYARLVTDHPEQREQTAQAWYRALLARGDWRAAQRLAGERILHPAGDAPAAPWVQAFLFASRRIGEAAPLAALIDSEGFPSALRPLFTLEIDLLSLDPVARADALDAAASAATDGFTAYYLARRLLDEKQPERVLRLASAAELPLADRERVRLRLDGLAGAGRDGERAALVRALLERPTHPAICELLSAHLVAYPQADLARALLEKMRDEPLPPGDAVYPQTLALLAACGASGDRESLQAAAALLRSVLGREFVALGAVLAAFENQARGLRPESILPILQPMPLDVAYALHDRYGKRP